MKREGSEKNASWLGQVSYVTKGFKHIVKTLLSATFMHSTRTRPRFLVQVPILLRAVGIEFSMEIAVVPREH